MSIEERFEAGFGRAPDAVGSAPGRLNLMGEHTDYNNGFVLPAAIGLKTRVAIGHGEGPPGTVRLRSAQFRDGVRRTLNDEATGHWSDYVIGAIRSGAYHWRSLPALDLFIDSEVPSGAGLSSSASLTVATLKAVYALLGEDCAPLDLCRQAQAAEADYVGMPCGLLDQIAVVFCREDEALFIDMADLSHEPVPVPSSHRAVAVHSGVTRKLGDGRYAARRKECEAAARALGVDSLRGVGPADMAAINALPAPLKGRARHVVTENERVRAGAAALKAGDAKGFGALMRESHYSQRNDFETSLPEIDRLVASAYDIGADGARLMGGGFGGSIVALVARERLQDWAAALLKRHGKARIVA